MGVGRRMGKKQGVPAPFEEFHRSKNENKRKFAPPPEQSPSKKRRKSDDFEGGRQPRAQRLSGKSKLELANGPSSKVAKSSRANGVRSAKHEPEQLSQGEDSPEEESDAGEEDEVLGDEFDLDGANDLSESGSGGQESDSEDSAVMDSDSEAQNTMWSDDDEDQEEAINAANIEGLSRHLDARAAQEAAEAQAELEEAAIQTNIAADAPPQLSDDDDDEAGLKTRLAPDLQLLRTRITDTIRVLDDFSKYSAKDASRSRGDYTRQLLKDICAYYGYSMFLAEKLFNLFPAREAFAFFEANETPRPIVIRTNTLRTHRRELAQALINRGVTLEPVGKWSKIGLQIFESAVPLGATPEYLAGHYIIQAASSFLPVMALAPQENERVLDMASAPGGKTTHIAAMMKNTGCIFANDSNKDRAKALIGNIHRLGVKNSIVCNYDALEFPKVMGGFDRVLLDAPCSGTGVISKDASVKTNKTEKDFMRLPHLQKQLLLAAIDSVDYASKTGGYIVYSTCSVTVEENEQVVQYALNKRPNVKLVETGINFGKEGFTNYMGKKFSPSMKMTRRYYPHAYNVDGFFVSKLHKVGPSPSNVAVGNGNAAASTNGDSTLETAEESEHPIPVAVEPVAVSDDPFASFTDDEDAEIIGRAERRSMRKKGINPKAVEGLRAKKKRSKDGIIINGTASKAEERIGKSKDKPVQRIAHAAPKPSKKTSVRPSS